MRVISMLPAATEMVFELGLGEQLVAVSHDCDYPAAACQIPRITHCEIHGANLPSAEVDRWVREKLTERGTLYTIDEPLLRRLAPDVILTQKLCDVCAPSYGSIAALADTLEQPPLVINLEPSSLADVLANVDTVAEVLRAPERGTALVTELRRRIDNVAERTAALRRRNCLLLEWLDPLYCSGHWGPELVELAGGVDPLGRKWADSVRVDWRDVVAAQPEVLLLACCGNGVQKTLEELPELRRRSGWENLPAVRNEQLYVVDGSSYFSRPGPRLVDSLEILAGLLHPEVFPEWRPGPISERRAVRVSAAGANSDQR